VLDQYPYLFAVILGLPAVALAFVLVPQQRAMMLLSGAVLALLSPLSVLHDGPYWAPQRLGEQFWGLKGWGLEDVLCTFSIGSLVWLSAIWGMRGLVLPQPRFRRIVIRFSAIAAVATAAIVLWAALGLTIMVATILVQVTLIVGLLWLRPALWAMPTRVALLYTPYYFAVLTLAGLWHRDFHAMWNGPEILGPYVLGLPIEELLWSASLGWFPLALTFALDASVRHGAHTQNDMVTQ
jgi:hypothetical protein